MSNNELGVMTSTTSAFSEYRSSDFPGMHHHPDDEADNDDGTQQDTSTSNAFKFPFFDNHEELDLSRSHNIDRFLSPPPPPKTNGRLHSSNLSSTIASPSDFGAMTLSPIAKNRESDDNALSGDMGKTGRDLEGQEQEEQHTPTNAKTTMSSPSASTPPLPAEDDGADKVVDDLQSARKQVGESSSNFIDKIRNAAHKRKVAVTRSRDSLVAKEQEQLRSIAASKALKSHREMNDSNNTCKIDDDAKENCRRRGERQSDSSMFRNPFKSRNGVGFSGCGVPKVEKRPTTTPFSPLLGSRRKQTKPVKALVAPRTYILKTEKKKASKTKARASLPTARTGAMNTARTKAAATPSSARGSSTFRARPMPASTGSRGRAGQLGVPKVPKRPVTVPKSPGLGLKRQSKVDVRAKKVASRLPSLETALMRPSTSSVPSLETRSSTPSNGENSGLLGLDFVGATPESTRHLVAINVDNVTPKYAAIKPFEPQSTKRANDRAKYDMIRDENRQATLLKERQRLHKQIRTIQHELRVLRDEI